MTSDFETQLHNPTDRAKTMQTLITDILGPNGKLGALLSNNEYRPQQVTMAEKVSETLLGYKRTAIIEAPTGSGKSLAYSVPAIIASWMTGEPVLISTSTKNLQAQLTEKDLPLLQRLFKQYWNAEFSFVVCKGRANYFCLRRWHAFIAMEQSRKKRRRKKDTATDIDIFADTMPETMTLAMRREAVKAAMKTDAEREAFDLLMDWYISDPKVGDTNEFGHEVDKGAMAGLWTKVCSDTDDCMGWKCEFCNTCYFMNARRQWGQANLCVVNHALFFASQAVKAHGGKPILPDVSNIIFDEADHVVGAAQDFYGTTVTSSWVPYTIDKLMHHVSKDGCLGAVLTKTKDQKEFTRSANDLMSISQDYFNLLGSTVLGDKEYTKRFTEPLTVDNKPLLAKLDEFIDLLDKAVEIHERAKNESLQTSATGFLSTFTKFQANLIETTSRIAPQTCYFLERMGKKSKYGEKITIKAIPIDMSSVVNKATKGFNCAYTSATIATETGVDYFASTVGVPLDNNLVTGVLPSPFDFQKNCLLCFPPMPHPKASDYDAMLAKRLLTIEPHVKGGIFFLFTSYSSMMNVVNATRTTLEQRGRPVFVQGVDGVKNKLVADFRYAKNGVLMGVSSFWVGVDVQGEALSCVLIAKMPFERPDDPFNQATREYMEANGRSYFNDYDLPRAIMMIRQGFGRLIRTKQDRGVVVILDPRLNPHSQFRKGYLSKVLGSLPNCPRTFGVPDIKAFFTSQPVQQPSGIITSDTSDATIVLPQSQVATMSSE